MALADSGNYHESRYFAMWPRFQGRLDEFHLPRLIHNCTGQKFAPFGEAVIATQDTCIGFEICEEFFVSNAPHTTMALDGVELFSNGSASHHELGKYARKVKLLKSAMARAGGIYLYANALGCDGDRLYHDGGSLVVANDHFVVGDGLFSLQDVVVVTATVDFEEVRTFRGMMQSLAKQAQYAAVVYPRVLVDFSLSCHSTAAEAQNLEPCLIGSVCLGCLSLEDKEANKLKVPTVEEELTVAPAMWLFDYLRRSGASGLFLPLSGGLDSCSGALIVYRLAQILENACKQHIEPAIVFCSETLKLQTGEFDRKKICGKLLLTCYMATVHSSDTTRVLAKDIADTIGSTHLTFGFDGVVNAVIAVIKTALSFIPTFAVKGGSRAEDLALQNIQARLRMVLSYAVAQLAPIAMNRVGPLLVMATGNAAECLRGYYTKYDCSSGDVNPLGSLDKRQLRKLVAYAKEQNLEMRNVLQRVLDAVPTAELVPLSIHQTDEVDMGMTYDDLALLGHLRSVMRLGPHSMRAKLDELRPEAAELNSTLVRCFYGYYSINRHKVATLPPTFHAAPTGPDDNRFDMRPLIYPQHWASQ
jgi:NAD+ synthase (glutamine-hydrolysing)